MPLTDLQLPDLLCGELAFLARVPEQDRLNSHDDIAEAYAVEVSRDVPGGCIIWGLYHGKWQANVSGRWIVTHLLASRQRWKDAATHMFEAIKRPQNGDDGRAIAVVGKAGLYDQNHGFVSEN